MDERSLEVRLGLEQLKVSRDRVIDARSAALRARSLERVRLLTSKKRRAWASESLQLRRKRSVPIGLQLQLPTEFLRQNIDKSGAFGRFLTRAQWIIAGVPDDVSDINPVCICGIGTGCNTIDIKPLMIPLRRGIYTHLLTAMPWDV